MLMGVLYHTSACDIGRKLKYYIISAWTLRCCSMVEGNAKASDGGTSNKYKPTFSFIIIFDTGALSRL